MSVSVQTSRERQWTGGSFAAAVFALFTIAVTVATSIWSSSWPTDGWFLSGNTFSSDPEITFNLHFLDEPSPIEENDQLLSINGQTVTQLIQTQHAFLTLDPPDWPDGTVLQYEVLREDSLLLIDVPIRRAGLWEYYRGAIVGSRISGLVQLFTGLPIFVIGLIVFLLRPSNRAAHALLLIGIGFFPFSRNDTVPTLFFPVPPISIPFDAWTLLINPSIMYLVLAFPYPKAPLKRFPVLSMLLLYLTWPVAFHTAYLLNMQDWLGYREAAFAIYPVQVILVMLVTLGALTHTIITVRDSVGRSQLKWMVVGIFGFVFVGIGGWLVSSYLFPETMLQGNWLITTLGWFLLPVSLAIAITRYRLFDIDVIIRRTLIYGTLTTVLALVYFGSVLLLQSVLQALTAQEYSPSVIVLSTLASAALFTPLRRRIQNTIDRRFFRSKYDAGQALNSFARSTREEVELDRLTSTLVAVVERTIQPEHASVWLRQSATVHRTRGNDIKSFSAHPFDEKR